jgi:GAF domain-containing protein
VRSVIRVLDAAQSTRQLLDEAVGAFGARCGAVHLMQAGQLQLLHTCGEWNGEPSLSVALESNGDRYGTLSLGARRNGRDYTPQDREALQQTAQVVAYAIALPGVITRKNRRSQKSSKQ